MDLQKKIEYICQGLLSSNVFILPTDTLYGLAANAYDKKAVNNVFAIKERPYDKQLPIHYHSIAQMEKDIFISENLIKLINQFMPGPLTLIALKRPESKLQLVNESVAVRIPNNKIMLEILKTINLPLTMPSANKHNKLPKQTFAQIAQELMLDGIADDANVFQVPSTIIDITKEKPIFIREGVIKKEEIEKALNLL
jgi:L-threonylcarbamoyladenylate synthase